MSHFLHTDRLREGLKDVIGRSDDDDVEPRRSRARHLPTVPGLGRHDDDDRAGEEAAFSPSKPMRLWVGGDSLAITPGESVINQAIATSVIDIAGNVVDGHVATGPRAPRGLQLARVHGRRADTQDNPDTLVLTIGSNDDQTLTGDGGVGPFGSPDVADEYRRRVGGLMDQITGDGKRTLFWVGHPDRCATWSGPRTGTASSTTSTGARRRSGKGKVVYIDIYDMFKAPDGGYADYLGSRLVQVRTPDGIHFTRAGGDLIAEKVIKTMQETFDLTSWQKDLPATTTTTAPAVASTAADSSTPGSTGPTSTTKAKKKKR